MVVFFSPFSILFITLCILFSYFIIIHTIVRDRITHHCTRHNKVRYSLSSKQDSNLKNGNIIGMNIIGQRDVSVPDVYNITQKY